MVKRPRTSRPGLLLGLAVALASTAAWAQKEVVALHACVISGGKPKAPTAELEAVCALEVSRTNVELINSTSVRAALEKNAGGSCAKAKNRNACLGKLATDTQARHALFITVAPYAPTTRVTGVVVDPSGKVVEQKSLQLARVRNQPPRDALRIAVAQLLAQLALTSAPATAFTEPIPSLEPTPAQPPQPEPPAVAQAPVTPAAPQQALTPPPAEPSSGRTWKTPAGIVGVGAGVVGLGLAALFTVQSNDDVEKLNAFYANGAAPQLNDENVAEINRLRDDADSKRTLAIASGAAGVVLAGVGAVLWLTDGPSTKPPAPGTARLLAGPGSVGLLVVLP
ncbi:hypothetical protein P2318_30595 [Myxococcaceae bacterium GXIMD 01537]